MSSQVWAKQQRAMVEQRLDALVVMSPENVTYTAGVAVPSQRLVRHRHAICIVPAQGDPRMICVDVEESFVRSAAAIKHVTVYNEFTQSPMQLLADDLQALGLSDGRIGIEATYLSTADAERLRQALPAARLVPVDALLAELRMIKTAEEIARLRRAAQVAEEVTLYAYHAARVGMTEVELGQIIADRYGKAGADGLTMLVVGAGERSSYANARPTERKLQPGDLLRTDVIGTIGYYYSDIARTAKLGQPTAEQAAVWSKLVDARNQALALIKPGASSLAIYQAYVEQMQRWNLPPLHFLGHGLGLSLHEEPYVNRYSDIKLQAGMVLAVEPLVWIADQWGMQLEEAVLVTEDGCESFSSPAYPLDRLVAIG